ncbi:MAG TPA: adenylate/guanylate cyclase domain-containing protein [Dehalococcoidia bacterium]|nr:adenylate/guanylate cyclase domain-containing protein [Dehalococcoidia bacterium]
MDPPRIQYARTKDGVSIAYYSSGTGFPLVVMPSLPVSHIEQELGIPEWRAWYEKLGRGRRVIRYDARGTGLSDRGRIERDVDAMVADLEAVVDRLGLERFGLLSIFYAVPPAIAYAARHPERLSHLLLFCGFARFADLRSPQLAAVRSLLDRDWELYTETAAHLVLGWSLGEPSRRFARFIRESVSPEAMAAIYAAGYDVTDLLAGVQAPTLVQHRREISWLPLDLGRRLAAAIPDARLEVLEGSSIAHYLGDSDAMLRGIDSFLGDRGEERPLDSVGGLQTIVFTDLRNHAEILRRLGDERGSQVLREHERITRESLRAHGGREVKSLGDGFMASFSSAQRALECAIDIQRQFDAWNREHEEALLVRIGVNAGEPIAEDDDLFGESVIAASRIASRAAGGEILVSNVVRELVAGKGFAFASRGEEVLRGFDDPGRIWELNWHQ